MSVSTISLDTGAFSRLELARALKEDHDVEPPENSAIFIRQRVRDTNSTPQRGSFYIPRPIHLLVPPVLGKVEYDNNLAQLNTPPPPILQQNQARRPSQQSSTSSPRSSVIIPEERRGSATKPATLMDVRESMLEAKHNLQNARPFSTASSQRNSIILQQHKTLPDANGKPHGSSKLSNVTNSRPNSLVVPSSSRPTSSYTNKSNENENESSKPKKSKKSKEIKKGGSSSSIDSDSASKLLMLPQINSVTNQPITLEKVEEDDSSEDDTPLVLKSAPKIKVAPPKITTTKKISSNGRIETWLEDVSGSPPSHPSTPGHSPTHSYSRPHSPRIRKTSEHSVHQSSPLGMGHIHDSRNHRPKSALVPDDSQVLKPDFYQTRKRSNSEFVPRIRQNSVAAQQVPPIPMGRVSPNPRQDSGYWAKDALSDDLRHINLMNESNSSISTSRSRSASVNGNGNNAKLPISKVINRHRREGSGSRPSSPQLYVHPQANYPQANYPQVIYPHVIYPQGNYLPSIQPSRSKDSLTAVYANRNNLYINNNVIHKKISSEQLMPANRNSGIYLHQNQQQKPRIRS